MAVSLSNQSLLCPPPCTNSLLSKSFTTLKSKCTVLPCLLSHYNRHHLHTCWKPLLGFPNGESSPAHYDNRMRIFKSYLAAQDSISPANDGEDTEKDVKMTGCGADEKHVPTLMSLIEVYKEAILDGDEKSLSEVEARILTIEKQKNELIKKESSLSAEIMSGKEKYIRLQADFENFRKRSEKVKLNVRSNAQVEVIENLLPMVDNFERAKQQIKSEKEREKKINASYQGIYKQFVEILRSHHVAAVATVGKPFDPSLHEAIAREESQEFKEGIIIQEVRRGFMLRDRLLRPATVKVSSGSGKKKAKVAAEKSIEQPATASEMDGR
ncbi:GrpE protein-like [Quillaja saponaria]|uniref:GrpE protein homolog n=1 Tax=Quillaja saponaria TaxID=32244 RepID=A0AAD7LJ27_QUISA|nr:GrpE protein-like [Quillaja saponaria]